MFILAPRCKHRSHGALVSSDTPQMLFYKTLNPVLRRVNVAVHFWTDLHYILLRFTLFCCHFHEKKLYMNEKNRHRKNSPYSTNPVFTLFHSVLKEQHAEYLTIRPYKTPLCALCVCCVHIVKSRWGSISSTAQQLCHNGNKDRDDRWQRARHLAAPHYGRMFLSLTLTNHLTNAELLVTWQERCSALSLEDCRVEVGGLPGSADKPVKYLLVGGFITARNKQI